MEKNTPIIEKRSVAKSTKASESKPQASNNAFLVLLIELQSLEIIAANLLAQAYFTQSPKKASLSFESILHPDDRESYQQYISSCRHLSEGEEQSLSLRLKSPENRWERFYFHHRISQTPKKTLLATAVRIEEFKKQDHNIPSRGLLYSKEKYSILVNSLDEGYFSAEMLVDINKLPIDFLILEANPAFETEAGTVHPVGKTLAELSDIPGEEMIQALRQIAITGEPKRTDLQFKDSWFNIYAFPVDRQKKGEFAVLFSNITREKTAEEKLKRVNEYLEEKVIQRTLELKKNSDFLQTIFDTSNVGIIAFEPVYDGKTLVDFRYVRVNTVITEQYQNDELVGRSYLEINPDAREVGVFQKFEASLRLGVSKEFEILYDRNGFNHWFKFSTKPIQGMLVVYMQDVTRQKLEAQRLRENIRFKKHLTRASPDIIMIFNLYDENIRYINRDMATLPGMRKRDILGKQLEEIVSFIHPSDRAKAMDFHTNLLESSDKDVLEFEFRLRGAKGRYQWYNALGKVFMRNKNAKVYEYMLLLRNIDQQIETQNALIKAEKLSIKGEIARTLAHELRNPLASIGMATDILSKKMAKEAQDNLQNYFAIIKRSTKVLNNLVSELLTSSNYSPAVLKKNCLAQILEEALQQAQDRIYLQGIQVTKNYQGNYFIQADDEKLKIALLNLIVNASEAMEPNSGELGLSINRSDDHYYLKITDNGCGLEEEQLEKLFDAFYTHRPGGMGIGLNSVKNILEEHHAEIEVESEVGKGTTFHLSFHCEDNY